MITLITGDWHLAQNERDAYRHAWQKRLRSMVRKHQVDHLILLGDITEEKHSHSAWLVNTIVDHLYNLSKLCRVTILRGNHDGTNPDNPFFEFTKRIENITWINKPIVRDKFLYLPHTTNYQQDWGAYDWLSDTTYVLAHNTFQGSHVGHGQIMRGIPLSFFPKGTRIISGDVHVPQTITDDKADVRVTYVGAPYTVDFGDSYNPRVLLLNDNKLVSISCSGPQKVLVEYKGGKRSIKPVAHFDGDIVKVRYHLSRAEFANWPAIKQQFANWAEQNEYILDSIQPVFEDNAITKLPTAQSSITDQEVLKNYAKRQGIDERTLKTGYRLMGE